MFFSKDTILLSLGSPNHRMMFSRGTQYGASLEQPRRIGDADLRDLRDLFSVVMKLSG